LTTTSGSATEVTGLSQAEVAERVAAGQVNTAPPEPGRSIAQILRANVCTRFNAILGTLFVVVLIVGPLQDALFGPVLVINTGIGVYQEVRAKRTLDSLAILTQAKARVLRDGQLTEIPVDELVRDDVLELHPGDQVSVDAAVLDTEGLELDEALLTGEAESVVKNPGDEVLSGSFVVAGTGRVRATGVGGEAYAAQLQSNARRFSMIRSELQQGTSQILRLVTWVMVPAAALLIVSQFSRSHDPFVDAVRGAVAGVVAMVPEGLVLLTSLAFTMGAMRLARRRVLVQELAAIEGLARVDVLCVDKTGTLTKPGMRVMETQVLGGWTDAQIAAAVGALIDSDDYQNATISALSERFTTRPGWTERTVVPFSSARKWSGATFAEHGSWLLGAPSVLAAGVLAAGVLDRKAGVSSDVSAFEAQGRRVLLLAHSPLALDGDQLPGELSPAALLVLAEELRDDTAETVRYLVEQGVTIKVMSGDAPGSVAAIAGRAGIPALGPPCDGFTLPEDQVGEALATSSVLGRVKPGQKLAGVKALQAQGHVVAMVGDGVNDVQALKQADLGIAMGSGSQASRAVARVVLLDGTFSAIPLMLAEGRRVIANIERVAGLFVTKTVYAALIAIAVGIAGIAYPFFPRHLTIISTFTIGVPGFFLALASGAPRAQPGFTRRVLTFAVPAGVAVGLAGLVSYLIARATPGIGVNAERTAAMLAVFAVAMWVLGLISRPLTAVRIWLLVAMVAGLLLVFAIPLGRSMFALELPPGRVLAAETAVALAAIIALTVWRARGTPHISGALGPGQTDPDQELGSGEQSSGPLDR
jgi:cation-transporting P-type ATPase E